MLHKFYQFFVLLSLFALLAGAASAQSLTLHLTDGQTLTGDFVSGDEKGILLKGSDGTYGERTAWGKLSQADLRELQQNPKLKDFVEPFIEVTQTERIKRTEIPTKDVQRLQRPVGHSVFGGIFGSGIGIFMLLIVYAGNIYAGYEISLFRGQAPGLVCGVSAVAPIIGPIIFLSMAPKLAPKADPTWGLSAEAVADAAAAQAATAAEVTAEIAQEGAEEGATPGQPAAPAAVLPPTKTFARGQFTFNRRFFETQMPKFFAVVRSDEDKDMVLTFRAARGTYVAARISRITANEIQLQVQKNNAFEDVTIPFTEIQEVQIKHKDA